MEITNNSNVINYNALQQPASEIGQLRQIEQLLEDFGPENVANGTFNEQLKSFCCGLRDYVMQQGGSEAFKDMAMDIIDSHENAASQPVSPELQSRLQDSGLQEAAQREGASLADASTGQSSESSMSYGDAYSEAMYGEAEKLEKKKKAKGGEGADALAPSGEGFDSSGTGGEGGVTDGNWLVAMAKRLAGVQGKFLDAAMENLAVMEASTKDGGGITDTGADTPEASNRSEADKESANIDKQEAADAKRNKFLVAQSKYSANMQMFNLMAQATSTSIKTVGEAMSAIARKQ